MHVNRVIIYVVFMFMSIPSVFASSADDLYKDFKAYRNQIEDNKHLVFAYFDDKFVAHMLSSMLLVGDEATLHNKHAVKLRLLFGSYINIVYHYESSCDSSNDCTLIVIFKKNRTGDFYKTGIHYELNNEDKLKNVSHLIKGLDFYVDKVDCKDCGSVIDDFTGIKGSNEER